MDLIMKDVKHLTRKTLLKQVWDFLTEKPNDF